MQRLGLQLALSGRPAGPMAQEHHSHCSLACPGVCRASSALAGTATGPRQHWATAAAEPEILAGPAGTADRGWDRHRPARRDMAPTWIFYRSEALCRGGP